MDLDYPDDLNYQEYQDYPEEKSDNGTLIIGNSFNCFNQETLITSCKVNPNYTTWSCNLLQTQINKRVFQNTFHFHYQQYL